MPIKDLREKYAAIHKQGWIPIFVRDRLEAAGLTGACVKAGLKTIEITCRRPDALEEIRRVRALHPDLVILAGSTVDSEAMIEFLKKRNPAMPSLEELAEAGADGFVAQLPFTERTLKKYRDDYILIPGAETLKEACEALDGGAHFVKFCAVGPERIKQIHSESVHKLLPLFVTGGVTAEKIPLYVREGVSVLAAGWDVMLGGAYERLQEAPCQDEILKRLKTHTRAFTEACLEHVPGYSERIRMDAGAYIAGLSHYHPF